MDQYMISVEGIFQECDKQGIDEVRRKLLAGAYGEKKKPIVEDWLKQQAEKDERLHKEKELQIGQEGLTHAAESNKIAREANGTARSALFISICAFIASIVMPFILKKFMD